MYCDYIADVMNYGIAYSERESYINNACINGLVALVLKLKDLVDLHDMKLEVLGTGKNSVFMPSQDMA